MILAAPSASHPTAALREIAIRPVSKTKDGHAQSPPLLLLKMRSATIFATFAGIAPGVLATVSIWNQCGVSTLVDI